MFSSGSVIGSDILDIGCKKAEMRSRRQRGAGAAPAPLVFGAPGQFDVPNVDDVRESLDPIIQITACVILSHSLVSR